jgi:PAS domain S-box-containing protein
MIWQYSPFFIPFITCGCIFAILALTGWKNRSYASAQPFALLMGAVCVWAFGTALEVASVELSSQMLALSFEYVGIVIVPVAWLIFALEYTGRRNWLTPRNLVLFSLIPAITVFMVATNDLHHLYYTAVSPVIINGLTYHTVSYGPFFWLFVAFSYLMVYVSVMLMVQSFVFTSSLYRGQLVAILVAALTPFFVNLAYVLRLGTFSLVDPTPFAFIISGFAVLFGMIRYQLLDITPLSTGQIVEKIVDGIVVVDTHDRIISLNKSAEMFIGIPQKNAVGKSVSALIPFAGHHRYQEPPAQSLHEQQFEMERIFKGKTQYFEIRFIPLFSHEKELSGKLIMIRDISSQKEAEIALSLARKKLNLLSSITRHDILNQVTAILLFTDNAKDAVTDPEVREWLEKQEQSAENIRHQIEFARDYETLGVNTPQWMSFNRIIADLKPAFASYSADCELLNQDIEIFSDPLLERVFYNLVDNSLQHGEHVTKIRFRHEMTQEGITLFYEDDGIGVPIESKQRIFERGVGRNTGLGLFLAKEILEITGMKIRETGVYGKGARFEIAVPAGHFRIPPF